MTVTAPATSSLLARFLDVRALTERLAAPLSPEDPAYTEGYLEALHKLDL